MKPGGRNGRPRRKKQRRKSSKLLTTNINCCSIIIKTTGGYSLDNLDKIYTTEQVTEYLQLPKETVWKLIRTGKLPALKIGRHYRIYEKDLKKFLEQAAK